MTTEAVSRREQLLATAAELFAARGFHGVSVAEIGAACGISGPALYKHFPSKDAILAEMLVAISEELLTVGRERVAGARRPRAAALGALVDWHVDFALRQRSLIVVQDRDWESLPPDAREQVRTLQRAYVDVWAGELGGSTTGCSADRARAMAHAAFGLINSTPHSGRLPDDQMRDLLTGMALDALGVADRSDRAPGDGPAGSLSRGRPGWRSWSRRMARPSVTMPRNFTLPGACGMHDRGIVPVLTNVSASCPTRASAQVFSDSSDPSEYQSDVPLRLRWSL